jgi:hypothetical protein
MENWKRISVASRRKNFEENEGKNLCVYFALKRKKFEAKPAVHLN